MELYSRQLSLINADPVLDLETVLYSLFSIQPGRGATLFSTIESEECRPSPGPTSCPLQEMALQVLIFTPYFEQRVQGRPPPRGALNQNKQQKWWSTLHSQHLYTPGKQLHTRIFTTMQWAYWWTWRLLAPTRILLFGHHRVIYQFCVLLRTFLKMLSLKNIHTLSGLREAPPHILGTCPQWLQVNFFAVLPTDMTFL